LSEQAELSAAVKGSFLFVHLSEAQRAALVASFRRRAYGAGEPVCRLDERGDAFFVCASGEFDVFLGPPPCDVDGAPPAPHFTYATSGGLHPCFGELALLYNQPRTASVVSRGAGALWALSRAAFRGAVRKTSTRELLRRLRTVALLRPLTAGQLQRLADGLDDVTFAPGAVILGAPSAPEAEAFYIVSEGLVRCDDGGGEGQRLGPGDTFGERLLLSSPALLAALPRRVYTAAGEAPTRCLRCTRRLFEELLGPLQSLHEADERYAQAAAQLPSAEELRGLAAGKGEAPLRTLWACDIGRVAVFALKRGAASQSVTLRQVSIARAAANGRQASVLRERAIAASISSMPFIPAPAASFADSRWLSVLLQTSAACSFVAALSQPLSEKAAAFYVAQAALALEHIHWHGALFRGLSPDTALLTAEGHLQLVDFRFTKTLLSAGSADSAGRTFTLCGAPEFLAPEALAGSGHDEAVDWWALGCFAFWLLTLRTPFVSPDGGATDQLQLFSAISRRALDFPPALSEPCAAQLGGLMSAEPRLRRAFAQLPTPAGDSWLERQGVSLEKLVGASDTPEEAVAQMRESLAEKREEEADEPEAVAAGDDVWWAGW
jgi:CRP-like cAMP-binding protein